MSLKRLAVLGICAVALAGCVVAPAPYPTYSYGYGPAYEPGYVAAPSVVVGGGWGWGHRHWRRW